MDIKFTLQRNMEEAFFQNYDTTDYLNIIYLENTKNGNYLGKGSSNRSSAKG